MKRATPVLIVEDIEPVLPFWVDRLGFSITNSVPEGDRLGFVILQKEGVEIMYQTRHSVAEDVAPLANIPLGGTVLFLEVGNLDAVVQALEGIEPVVPRRKTFYGSEELIVREPGGNVVNFAQFSS